MATNDTCAMPVNMSNSTCMGLSQAEFADEDACRQACCNIGREGVQPGCDVYQWCPNSTKGCSAGPAVGTAGPGTCWLGVMTACDAKNPSECGCKFPPGGFSS